jgi:hypothetical protein
MYRFRRGSQVRAATEWSAVSLLAETPAPAARALPRPARELAAEGTLRGRQSARSGAWRLFQAVRSSLRYTLNL